MHRWSAAVLAIGGVLALTACGGSPDASAPAAPAAGTSGAVAAPTPSPSAAPPPTTETPSVTPTATTTSPAAPTTLVDVPFERNEAYYFVSPDGRFTCGIVQLPHRTEAGCEGVTTPVPPRPDDCIVSWGNGIRVEDAGPGAFMCSGGQVYTSGAADPVLAPGTELAELGFTCAATATSITCTNDATGHGFTIAPDSNETF